MNRRINLIIIHTIFALGWCLLLGRVVLAFAPYQLLEPSVVGKGDGGSVANWGEYSTAIIKAFYAFIAVSAVTLITWNGFRLMISGVPGVKTDAKTKIWNIIFGLLLALGSYLILQTVNPDLLIIDFAGWGQ